MSSIRCPNCAMKFTSAGQLYKHQAKFCVGGPAVHTKQPPTIHDDDAPSPRYFGQPPNTRIRELQLAASRHGKNLQNLHYKNAKLEEQKQEIERRLSRLGRPDATERGGSVTRQLHQQGDRNQEQLDQLRQQLHDLANSRPGRTVVELLPEILAMRQTYLKQGGSNPGILAKMADLEAEVRGGGAGVDPRNKNRKQEKNANLNKQLLTYELENQRLQNELLVIQERNNDRTRNLRNKENAEAMDDLERETRQRQKEHLQKLGDLEHEIEVTKQEARLERLRREMAAMQQPMPGPMIQQPAPALMTGGERNDADSDPLLPTPYDQTSGFMLFYDLAVGLEPSTQFLRLVTCLYNSEAQYGEPTMLPTVQAEPESHSYYSLGAQQAVLNTRQPVPRCPPVKDMSVLVELQSSLGGGASRLDTRGWAKLDLFDVHGRLLSGRWRVPLRITPIRPEMSTGDLLGVPQYATAELCVRIVNARDADLQATSSVTAAKLPIYAPAPVTKCLSGVADCSLDEHPEKLNEIKILNAPPPMTQPSRPKRTEYMPSTPPNRKSPAHGREPTPRRPSPMVIAKRTVDYDYDPSSSTIGFQVDRVKGAELGEGKLRLTAYHSKSGKVVQSSTGPVTCTTTAVRAQFKYFYHVYGQQEATFHDVDIRSDMILIVRFYLRKALGIQNPEDPVESGRSAASGKGEEDPENGEEWTIDASRLDNETLVTWGVLPLMVDRHGEDRVNVGTHVLKLYRPPVPDANSIPLEEHWVAKDWKRYRNASARVHVFQGSPRPGSLTSSDLSDTEDDIMPQGAWMPHERHVPPKEPFTATDGIDLYIDGARFLPDSVTISRVAGRMLNRNYEKSGKDLNVNMEPDCDIYNPIFNYKIEFREPNINPTSTILLKLYTVDKYYNKLTVVGYAVINVFVVIGTEKQPKVDTGGVQLALNEGYHQLRLYTTGPNGVDPLTAGSLRVTGSRTVPCASLLVRLYKAPLNDNGRPMNMDRYPQLDWERLGVWRPLPRYKDRVYYSMECKPTNGECLMLQTQVRRQPMSTRDAIRIVEGDRAASGLSSEKQVAAKIKGIMTKTMDQPGQDIDLTFMAAYVPKYGIKVAIDSAMNLPWSNFTHATVCLNPPGAFYMGPPRASYDQLKFTRKLDLSSTTKSPVWHDNFFHFPQRSYHKYLTVVIHLQEISATVQHETYKYGLLNQAWTVLQVFNEGYVKTDRFQLPLFHGPPKMHLLRQLAKDPTKKFIIDNVTQQRLKPVDFASVFVRLCDGRRDEELPPVKRREQVVNLNVDMIPPQQRDGYAQEQAGTGLTALVPPGKPIDQFTVDLADKFKSLVHKLYEESALRQT